ncbi:4-(cytidine 5'-diphospho)-2-C-methyl-D-erythritol kinase [Tundrisphaera lichenicola]|uniref:4-(cytidine 5'-diphospho)-2-C-methyl-D-erythritol kinase n=1 Tax=Tundrisphaera lichenicola TaxID=2029860 RepID=UPI003EBD2571
MRYHSSTALASPSLPAGVPSGFDPMIVRSIEGGLEVQAPAKLNLFLEILGRRPDGYHELESLMVATDLRDTLTFADDPSGQIHLTCDDPALSTGPDNLVVMAAERLRAEAGVTRGARITLRKAIPAQAGLAGGSSDAAATLIGLDRLWDLGASPAMLDELAATIGSDVAFFRQGPCAVCRGRGEIVESRALPVPLHIVLICPPVGVSTAAVYRNLIPPERPRPIGAVLEALDSGDIPSLGRSLFNRLQPVAESLEPSLGAVGEALVNLGPSLDGHLMSGSGSAYFGLARDRDAAEDAARRLGELGLGRVRVVTCGP